VTEGADSALRRGSDSGTPLVGILGGGQLGRMLALAGLPLGLRFRFLEPADDPSVAGLGEIVRAGYDDRAALDDFATGLSVVTYEFENVPAESVRYLAQRVPVFPAPAALEVTQDRVAEKEAFRSLGIATAPFRTVDDLGGLEDAVELLGLPAVLKTRRFGYDGKGQRFLHSQADLAPALAALGGEALILEGFVSFTRELSLVCARGGDGDVVFYPLAENEHRDGILSVTKAPAPGLTPSLQQEAEDIGQRLVSRLDYVGAMAVELFETSEGLLANEMAPRVHNSGHWTQDGAVTSQFENHLRAVLGLPLGSPEARGMSAMVNLIGSLPDRSALLALPGVHLHLYDKEVRPGRKLGHVNVLASTDGEREEKVALVRARVGSPVGRRDSASRSARQAAQASQSP